MIIEFERGISDAKRWFRNSNICIRNFFGKTVGMARTVPANPRTDDQTAARDSMKSAGQAWRELPEPNRGAWNNYARRYASEVSDQRYKDLSGWEFFLPAWRNRALLGIAPDVLPADAPPPPPVLTVEEVFSGDSHTYTFRVTHNAVPDGHVLLVRMTPQTATLARKPQAAQARMIRGHCADSALPLPASGGTVTFTGARFAVESGHRFGLALRVVRLKDGVHSREFFADLHRAGEPPSDNPVSTSDTALSNHSVPPAAAVPVARISRSVDNPDQRKELLLRVSDPTCCRGFHGPGGPRHGNNRLIRMPFREKSKEPRKHEVRKRAWHCFPLFQWKRGGPTGLRIRGLIFPVIRKLPADFCPDVPSVGSYASA